MRGPIVLLTDFGLKDAYVGVMKGVIISRVPAARIIDLTHGVAPQDVRGGAFHLMSAVDYFPAGTLFVCVVDPGVGSRRSILWARSARHEFLAPDNGILSWAAKKRPLLERRQVTNKKLFLKKVSKTFHGRDIFAPVAAALVTGTAAASLGPKVRAIKTLPFPTPGRHGRKLAGEVLVVDRFGNVVTNLRPGDVGKKKNLSVRKTSVGHVRERYSSVGIGRPLAVVGSSGFVELSLREGNFSEEYGVYPGEAVYAG